MAEFPARRPEDADPRSSLEGAADLARLALADAGLRLRDVDGLYVGGIHESAMFLPSTVAEYLGIAVDHGGVVDLGGANPAAMVARAAAAIAVGDARVVLCLTPGWPSPAASPLREEIVRFGASSYRPGSPQAEFDIPYGHLGQNALYALIARRYAAEHGYDGLAIGRLVSHLRDNAAANPAAIFFGQPVTAEEVAASPLIADPIRRLEIVRPARGGAAVVLAASDLAWKCKGRAAFVAGWGERLAPHKSPQYAPDLLAPPMIDAARRAFDRAGLTPADMDGAQVYDCYAINVLLTLEGAGFWPRGEGMRFLKAHDMRWHGDFPVNTNGGQLGMGQAGLAGGMTHIVEAYRQIAGRAGDRQIPACDTQFVSGNGGIMSEQIALVLRGG
ncbi:thiolase family protein [Rhizorhabdus wittichii]|uniref:thiolase family protein n=1 Tax=Rhizorhabdus wittichii TaxID=160791 RepID=UPI0003145208|nr:thiolase family protein [Rhizorhabdus wittichii]